jgi:hypothetical protein
MKRIRITRDDHDNVQFETVSVDTTENVFFLNQDPKEPHHPSIADNQLGPAPSAPSSQCIPEPAYTCLILGHENEGGVINIVEPLAAVSVDAATNTVKLENASSGQPITRQQVVEGGKSPYKISSQFFEITDVNSTVIQNGSGIGPGLQLSVTPDDKGVWVSGTPTVSGTYNFTFSVDDATGANIQQVQYQMEVAA